jgi:integrase
VRPAFINEENPMSVRREKQRDRSGKVREFWIVDVDLKHPDGRRGRVRKVAPIQTKRGAEQYERELRQSLLDGTHGRKEEVELEAPRLTFNEFVEKRWWPTYPSGAGNRPSTIREKEIHLRVHLKPVLGGMLIQDIRGETVMRFLAALRKQGLSDKTVRNVRATLHKIIVSATEWGVLDAVPRLPRVKVADSSFDFLTREETEKLLGVARSPEEYVLLLFAVRTGARAGEQIALEWGDLDWNSRKVILRRSSTRGVVGPTKSGRERKVPLSRELERALRAIRHLRGKLVFCNPDGRPLSLWQLHERIWGACRRAGLRRIRWHDLRHTFASHLVMANVPLRQVQDWMGHSTIMMTMRYSHLAPGTSDVIDVLDGKVYGQLTAMQGGEAADPPKTGTNSGG